MIRRLLRTCSVFMTVSIFVAVFAALAPPAAPQSVTLPPASRLQVLDELPPPPSSVSHRHRRLHLVRGEEGFLLADNFGNTFACGRDASGNLIPVVFDPDTQTYVPCFYDPARDAYCAEIEDDQGEHYRCILQQPIDNCYVDTGFTPSLFAYAPPIIAFPSGFSLDFVVGSAPIIENPFLFVRSERRFDRRRGERERRTFVADPVRTRRTQTFHAAPPRVITGQTGTTGQVGSIGQAPERMYHRGQAPATGVPNVRTMPTAPRIQQSPVVRPPIEANPANPPRTWRFNDVGSRREAAPPAVRPPNVSPPVTKPAAPPRVVPPQPQTGGQDRRRRIP